jgi:hypothetical protein
VNFKVSTLNAAVAMTAAALAISACSSGQSSSSLVPTVSQQSSSSLVPPVTSGGTGAKPMDCSGGSNTASVAIAGGASTQPLVGQAAPPSGGVITPQYSQCATPPPLVDFGPGPGTPGGGSCDPNCGGGVLPGGGGGQVARGADCTGAKANNTTAVPGSSDHNNMIATGDTAMLSILFAANASQDVAFEYQTYGGQEYVQFFVTGSASGGAGVFALGVGGTHSPMAPFNGNIYVALSTAANVAGYLMPQLPAPLNQIQPGMQLVRTPCNPGTVQTVGG